MTYLLFVQIALPFLKRKVDHDELLVQLGIPRKSPEACIFCNTLSFLHHYEEEKDLQSGESRLPHWNKMCRKPRVERSEDVSSVGRNSDSEALQKIINKLSKVRNLKDLLLKHNHVPSAQFEKNNSLAHSWKGL